MSRRRVETRHGDPSDADGRSLPLMARVLLAIWVGGTSTYTIGLLVKPPPDGVMPALWSVTLVALLFTAGLWLRRDRLPGWAPDASGVACFVLASTVVVASRDPGTPAPLFYLWVIVTSCYFVSARRAAAQIMAVAVTYGIALAFSAGPFPWDRWTLLSLTAVAVGWTVATLRAREVTLVAQLDRMARTDALTGLLNRRGFDEALARELARADRSGEPLALIIGDLDRFKMVNDLLGHSGGDAVLRRAAEAITATVRRVDIPARLGGEEFAVICPSCGSLDAYDLAERIRERIGEALSLPGTRVTVSFGAAVYPRDAAGAEALFKAADDACYAAKRLGRDRTVAVAGYPELQR